MVYRITTTNSLSHVLPRSLCVSLSLSGVSRDGLCFSLSSVADGLYYDLIYNLFFRLPTINSLIVAAAAAVSLFYNVGKQFCFAIPRDASSHNFPYRHHAITSFLLLLSAFGLTSIPSSTASVRRNGWSLFFFMIKLFLKRENVRNDLVIVASGIRFTK